MKTQTWTRCYEDSWKGWIVDPAFAHPAKAARGLLAAIFAHLKNAYGLKRGAVVLDPFGGIGTTGIVGASRGYRVVCVELEDKFVKLALQNFKLHARTWETFGDPAPLMLQGDSRKLRQVLSEVDCVVSSPPYAGSEATAGNAGNRVKAETWGTGKRIAVDDGYGSSPGQLGAMPAGKEGLLFLQEGRVVQPDPARLGDYAEHAGGRHGHWPSSSEIGSAMLDRYR